MEEVMNRKQFIQQQGADCDNWTWSWSFVNHVNRFVIFGAWDHLKKDAHAKIFSKSWEINVKGDKSRGYKQSLKHIHLIQDDGYKLYTFPMRAEESTLQDYGIHKIDFFTPELTQKDLLQIGDDWFAGDNSSNNLIAEELNQPNKYPEGAKKTVVINAYERNPEARAACIAHYGYLCAACGFDFFVNYGELGKNFIHVHHVNPISSKAEIYEIDPINDLIPVCPNCHAMIHRVDPCLSISQLRLRINQR
jgi:5-methylcytosine-specific restriction enzyme A